MNIEISPQKVAQVLAIVVLCLISLSVIGQTFKHFGGDFYSMDVLVRITDLDDERNLPTWYSSATLLLCSALFAATARIKRRQSAPYVWHWLALSVIFLLMSLDETASIHEREIARAVNRLGFGLDDAFRFLWIIPGAAFVLILGWSFRGFILHLPSSSKRLFLAAGTLFVSGALGVETLGFVYAYQGETDTFAYSIITTIEESLEMVGVVVLIYAMTLYLGSVSLQVIDTGALEHVGASDSNGL